MNIFSYIFKSVGFFFDTIQCIPFTASYDIGNTGLMSFQLTDTTAVSSRCHSYKYKIEKFTVRRILSFFFWVSNTKYNYVYSRNNTYQTKLLGKYCKKLVWNVKQYATNAQSFYIVYFIVVQEYSSWNRKRTVFLLVILDCVFFNVLFMSQGFFFHFENFSQFLNLRYPI